VFRSTVAAVEVRVALGPRARRPGEVDLFIAGPNWSRGNRQTSCGMPDSCSNAVLLNTPGNPSAIPEPIAFCWPWSGSSSDFYWVRKLPKKALVPGGTRASLDVSYPVGPPRIMTRHTGIGTLATISCRLCLLPKLVCGNVRVHGADYATANSDGVGGCETQRKGLS